MLYFDPNAEGCRVLNRTLRRCLNNKEDPFNYRRCKHTKHKSYGSQTRTSVESITIHYWSSGPGVGSHMQRNESSFLNNLNCYRPQTKLRKGNVFTSVCQEFCPQVILSPRQTSPTPMQTATAADGTQSSSLSLAVNGPVQRFFTPAHMACVYLEVGSVFGVTLCAQITSQWALFNKCSLCCLACIQNAVYVLRFLGRPSETLFNFVFVLDLGSDETNCVDPEAKLNQYLNMINMCTCLTDPCSNKHDKHVHMSHWPM